MIEAAAEKMAQAFSVPLKVRLARAIMRPIFRGIFHILSQVEIIGRENVPATGAYLIAINHVSLFEPPFILAFWPVAPEAIGAVDIWERPGQSALARLYGGIPVRRGEYDRLLIDRVLAVLKAGRPLLLAPEGGRSHTLGMREALPGVAYIVEKSGAPVIPVGISGTSDDFFQRALHAERPKLTMRIGRRLDLPPVEGRGDDRRKARQTNANLIMQAIAELLPPEYQGIYADKVASLPKATE